LQKVPSFLSLHLSINFEFDECRCKREFVGEEEWETRCYYHPGVWKEPTSDDPGWSCCRNSLMPITDFKEFFAYQESVEVPNLKDMLDEYAAKSLQQFRSVLERQVFSISNHS